MGGMPWNLLCGSNCIQVGTANFMNPATCLQIIEEMDNYLRKEGIHSLEEIRVL
jgi:dihydroorotate dehydrogenase (NAD+) catalytic subunit